ncbi:uncharacterized protein [Aegilops tauschii subsp. strangulata]|uniref:uncharacterized protein n=1 Tax=Aegilops tauschii subsp. strangulata TaxID=200361 RepID=UPI00098A9CFD|nr:ethylene-responsive transcription factor CRF5-like [Aegilops tauschii subsp. strangulata]
MPPRRRGVSGYRGVRQRPNGGFYSEIRSDQLRLGLGTFETAHEAARAYDAAAWRLGRPRPQMNFDDVHTLQQALDVAPPPRLRTAQDCAEHAERQRRLLVAHEDERTMAEWRRRHPEDVTYEQAYWARRREEDTRRRREERLDRRRRKALAISQCDIIQNGGQSIFSADDDHWLDMWIDTSDQTSEDGNDDDDDDDWE